MGPRGLELVREERLVGGGCEQGQVVVVRHDRVGSLMESERERSRIGLNET